MQTGARKMRMAARRACLFSDWLSPPARSARAQADDYPSRTVTFICPFPAGGGTDILVRLLAASCRTSSSGRSSSTTGPAPAR